jgi:Flp pilus assembly protein TadG
MVEFALIVPLLLILLLGVIEFGRAYNTQIALQGAAREGARALALGGSASAAVADAHGLPDSVVVSTATPRTCAVPPKPDTYATVRTSTNFTFGIPFIPLGSISLSAEASMRCGL